jgi:GYF domain 2
VYPNVRMPFPITCTACQKTFSIADDVYERKVKGRVVTIKCKQCQAGIRVDGTKDTPVFSAADAPAMLSAVPAVADVAPPRAEPGVPPEAPAPPPVVVAAAPVATPAAELPAPPPVVAAVASKAAPAVTAVKAATPAAASKVAPVTAAKAPATAVATKASPMAVTAKAAPAGLAPKAAPTPAATPKVATPALAPKAAQATATPLAGGKAPPTTAPLAARAPLGAARAPMGSAPRVPLTAATRPAAALAPMAAPVATPPVAAAAAVPPPAVTPPPAPVAAPEATAVPEMLWAVDYPDGQDRELTLVEITKELASGAINPTSLVWREGMAEWLELGQVPELQKLVAAPPVASAPEPTAPAPPAAAPPPPARAKAPSAAGFDLPPARAKAPSAAGFDLPPARPPAPSAPAIDLPKISPSAPVIDFGLHGATSSAPPPPIPRSPTMAGIGRLPTPPTPFEAPATPPAPAFPPAPVMVPAPALAAPFATQSFARQQMPAPVGATAPTANIPDWPEKKSRTPLIIGIVVAVLAIGGGVVFMTQSDDELPPPVPISALPATAPTATPSVPNTTADTAATPPTTDSPSPGPGSGAALRPPNGAPTATPNAGFAELFASSARHADEKAGPAGTQRFDVSAANKALATATFETAKCREKGGPMGKATIVVTFEPSGKVASATVSDAPFAGTSSGACIAAAMKRATVPPFSGLPGTATKVISIQ